MRWPTEDEKRNMRAKCYKMRKDMGFGRTVLEVFMADNRAIMFFVVIV